MLYLSVRLWGLEGSCAYYLRAGRIQFFEQHVYHVALLYGFGIAVSLSPDKVLATQSASLQKE